MMRFLEETTYYTADTHLRHKRILEYQPNRKYVDINAMNDELIAKWNAIVPVHATVIHHGDFAFASRNRIREFKERLNGRIILIMGNHDHYRESIDIFGAENVFDSLVYRVGEQLIHSCHYPMASWKDAEEGSWHLHGHYHGHTVDGNLYKRKDVGIDTHPEERPYAHAEIKEFMDTRTVTPIRHPK